MSVKLPTRFIIGTNAPPILPDASGAMSERMGNVAVGNTATQRHLLLLHRFGLIIWGEGNVFRMATREERIAFIENGIKERFRPIGAFVVRKPMM